MHNELVIVLLLHTNCTAQGVYPLNTSALNIPEGSYFKDINNELNTYTGKWKTVVGNKITVINISKRNKVPIKFLGKNYYQDMVDVRYEMKDINGKVLESTLETPF
ncbi:hypothetical protein LEQ04_03785 [Riemerella anatipestifer]|nr:hypothetical protein LEQ05_08290 [Riemerella anatipestifer]WPC12154.1 hypothetical protein LEQ03_07350 [Riemerella anatipestifer]WPC15989.1 hypothetical protein LEQ04_03785 [Riemerella anatipestifer]